MAAGGERVSTRLSGERTSGLSGEAVSRSSSSRSLGRRQEQSTCLEIRAGVHQTVSVTLAQRRCVRCTCSDEDAVDPLGEGDESVDEVAAGSQADGVVHSEDFVGSLPCRCRMVSSGEGMSCRRRSFSLGRSNPSAGPAVLEAEHALARVDCHLGLLERGSGFADSPAERFCLAEESQRPPEQAGGVVAAVPGKVPQINL